jgi:hypothetical protein
MKDQLTRMTSTPPEPSESEKQRKIAALAFDSQADLPVGDETGTVRPWLTTEGLSLIAPLRS